MNLPQKTLLINANIAVTPDTLKNIVANVKQIAGTDNTGFYHVDTADKVGEMISRFLLEKNFEEYVKDIKNYT